VDVYPEEKIAEFMRNIRGVIANCTQAMPTHEEFIAKHCAAKPM
jgi:tryptophan halogenase